MKGPLQLIRRRSAEHPAQQADDPQPTTEAPTEAASAADGPAAQDPATTEASAVSSLAAEGEPAAPPAAESAPREGEPAGQEPPSGKPSFRHRGRMRRRLRYLRRVRELGFRDLGGLVFDQHKFGHPSTELVGAKLGALAAVDSELRALEHALDDRRTVTELREPGISVCPRCGALHGSDAHYCPSCGTPFQGPRAMAGIGEGVSTTVGEIGTVAPTPPAQIGPPAPEPYATAPLWAQPRPEAAEEPAAIEPSTGAADPPTQALASAGEDPPTEVHQPPAGEDQPTEAHEAVPEASANGDAAERPAGERSET